MTGGVAAGKSEALAAFERLGAMTVSADDLVHDLLDREPLVSRIRGRWGDVVFDSSRIDRTAVGAIVFADPAELSWLESQVHPLVRDEIASWFERADPDSQVAVVEVPLLFEGELHGHFDATVAVVSDEGLRRERADGRGHAGVEGREARQLSQEEKAERADHVVVNDGTIEDLEGELRSLLAELGVQVPPGRPG